MNVVEIVECDAEDGRVPTIGVVAGDGIGPEVVREALTILEAVNRAHDLKLETVPFDLGGERV